MKYRKALCDKGERAFVVARKFVAAAIAPQAWRSARTRQGFASPAEPKGGARLPLTRPARCAWQAFAAMGRQVPPAGLRTPGGLSAVPQATVHRKSYPHALEKRQFSLKEDDGRDGHTLDGGHSAQHLTHSPATLT